MQYNYTLNYTYQGAPFVQVAMLDTSTLSVTYQGAPFIAAMSNWKFKVVIS